MQLKDNYRTERKSLCSGSKACCGVWFGNGGTNKKTKRLMWQDEDVKILFGSDGNGWDQDMIISDIDHVLSSQTRAAKTTITKTRKSYILKYNTRFKGQLRQMFIFLLISITITRAALDKCKVTDQYGWKMFLSHPCLLSLILLPVVSHCSRGRNTAKRTTMMCPQERNKTSQVSKNRNTKNILFSRFLLHYIYNFSAQHTWN